MIRRMTYMLQKLELLDECSDFKVDLFSYHVTRARSGYNQPTRLINNNGGK
jgi:hypothetical protein